MKCPACQTDNKDTQNFCRACGWRLKSACPECGAMMSAGDRFCGECGLELGTGEPLPFHRPSVNGERKHITALFADLSGYTTLAERLDPEEVRELTSRFFGDVAKIISRYEGFIEKFAGDAVLALFGVPAAHEDDPVRALRAAQEIHRLVKMLSQEFQDKVGESLAVHIGINTGLVVTGEMRLEDGIHHVAGDTVNVASRLCSLAPPGETLVGQATCAQTEGFFTFEKLAPVLLKGKTLPVPAYRLVAVKDTPTKRHRLSGLRAALVGRETEMRVLQEALAGLIAGRSAVIAVIGEAGTGKTRLVEEFKAGLDPNVVQWFDGYAYAYNQNVPYHLIIDLFRRIFKIEEKDPSEVAREKVASHLHTLLGDHDEVLPYLGGLLAIAGFEAGNSNPETWKARMQEACLAWWTALVRSAPTVFNLEDLHWADPSSLELLRFLLSRLPCPAFFLCTCRPPFVLFPLAAPASLAASYQELPLAELSPADTQQMVASLLSGAVVPAPVQKLIQDRVGGNPFYIEEFINALIEAKILAPQQGEWQLAAHPREFQVPGSIHGIIAARLDRLNPAAKGLLQEAAVMGRSFYREILESITFQAGNLDRHLHHLQELDLIRVRSRHPDLEYAFKHVLIQEATYNGLLKKHRRDLHERVGLALERFYAERGMEAWEPLAFHFKRGRSRLKAVTYLIMSGKKSVKRYALEEAWQYFQEAYDLLADNSPRSFEEDLALVELLMQWCLVFYYQGRFEGMTAMLLKHQEVAEALPDRAKLGEYYNWLGHATFWQGARLEDSYRYLKQALILGEDSGHRSVTVAALSFLIKTCAELGYLEEARVCADRAQKMLPEFAEDIFLHLTYYSGRGYLGWFLGDQQMLHDSARELLDYAHRHASRRAEMVGDMLSGFWHFINQDLEVAMGLYRRVLAQGDPYHAMFARLLLGMALAYQRQFDQAAAVLTPVIDYGGRERTEYLRTIARLFLGVALAAQGHLARGLNLMTAARTEFAAYQRVMFHILSECLLGAVYLKIYLGGEPREWSFYVKNAGFLLRNMLSAGRQAEEHLQRARQLAAQTGARGFLGQPCLLLGRLYMAKGQTERARKYLEEALHVSATCQLHAPLKEAQELLSCLP